MVENSSEFEQSRGRAAESCDVPKIIPTPENPG